MRAHWLTIPLLVLSVPALACMHLPRDYEGSVEQASQAAIVLWSHGREDLILKVDYRVTSATGSAPSSLAWVVPLPSEPTSYGTADPEVFRDAHDAYERAVAAAYAAANVRSTHTPEGLELLAPVSVGDYAIQPIKARGPESAQALNTWLAENGFSTVPVANMAYYLERRWVWLAIKANVSAVKGELRPLRVAFPSERVVYPLKFSTHQGVFDVTLWVFSAKPLRGFRRYGHAGSMPPLQGDHPAKAYGLRFAGHDVELPARLCGSTTLPRQVHLTKVTGRVNTPERPLAAWPNDLSLEP